jgi:hypothetical protein
MRRRAWLSAALIVVGAVGAGFGVAGALGAFDPHLPAIRGFRVAPSEGRALARRVGLVPVSVAPFVPVAYSIPALDVHRVRILPEGDPGGVLTIPPIQTGVAWWDGGALAGSSSGTTLLAGHVDWVGYGNGPMQRIWDLKPGMIAVLYGARGQSQRYVAVSLTSYLKTTYAAAASRIIPRNGPNQLVMVTCGGSFDPFQHQWNSDVVATFVPLGESASASSHG